jgi:hypothetical protein
MYADSLLKTDKLKLEDLKEVYHVFKYRNYDIYYAKYLSGVINHRNGILANAKVCLDESLNYYKREFEKNNRSEWLLNLLKEINAEHSKVCRELKAQERH